MQGVCADDRTASSSPAVLPYRWHPAARQSPWSWSYYLHHGPGAVNKYACINITHNPKLEGVLPIWTSIGMRFGPPHPFWNWLDIIYPIFLSQLNLFHPHFHRVKILDLHFHRTLVSILNFFIPSFQFVCDFLGSYFYPCTKASPPKFGLVPPTPHPQPQLQSPN